MQSECTVLKVCYVLVYSFTKPSVAILISQTSFVLCLQTKGKAKSNDKLWCYGQSNKSLNLELSPLFTCKISRLANYQNLSNFKSSSKWEITFVDSLSTTLVCRINRWFISSIMENRLEYWWLKTNTFY